MYHRSDPGEVALDSSSRASMKGRVNLADSPSVDAPDGAPKRPRAGIVRAVGSFVCRILNARTTRHGDGRRARMYPWHNCFRSSRAAAREAGKNLTELAATIAARASRTESDFVALGADLRNLHANSAALEHLVSDRVGSLRMALSESRIAGPDGVSATAVRELQAALVEFAQQLDALRRLTEELEGLGRTVCGIERIGVILKTLVVGFAIESARTPECQLAFGSFVEDLRLLASRIGVVSETVGQHVESAYTVLADGLRDMGAGAAELERLAKQLTDTAGVTAAGAQALLDDTLARLQEVEQSTKRLAQHVGGAVYHMQSGDIVRQKSEHVVDALREARDLLAAAPNGAEARERLASADHMAAIEVSQLEAVRSEIATAHDELAAAFQGIASESHFIHEAVCRWDEGETASTHATDAVRELAAEMRHFTNLRDEESRLRSHAHDIARRAVEASSGLSAHVDEVRSINRDMHLHALNAIVRTAVLGDEGKTLEVLSMSVDALSRESSRVVAAIVASLERFLRHAHAALPAEDTAREDGAAADHLQMDIEAITRAYDGLRATSTSAAGIVEQQGKMLSASEARLEFLATLSAEVAGEAHDLKSLREALARWTRVAAPRDGAALDQLRTRYTMASERAIHERAARGEIHNAETPRAAEAPDANLELFDAPSPVPQVATVLSEEQSVLASAAQTNGSSTSELGDNVDLF